MVVLRQRKEIPEVIWVHPWSGLIHRLRNRDQRCVIRRVPLTPVARDHHVEDERRDNSSAVSGQDMRKEVYDFNFALVGISKTRDSTLVLLIGFICETRKSGSGTLVILGGPLFHER